MILLGHDRRPKHQQYKKGGDDCDDNAADDCGRVSVSSLQGHHSSTNAVASSQRRQGIGDRWCWETCDPLCHVFFFCSHFKKKKSTRVFDHASDDVSKFASLSVAKHVVHTQVNLSCSAEHRKRFDVPNTFGRGALQDIHLSDASVVVDVEHTFLRMEFIVEDTEFCRLMTLLSPKTTLVRTMCFTKKNRVFCLLFLPVACAQHDYTGNGCNN